MQEHQQTTHQQEQQQQHRPLFANNDSEQHASGFWQPHHGDSSHTESKCEVSSEIGNSLSVLNGNSPSLPRSPRLESVVGGGNEDSHHDTETSKTRRLAAISGKATGKYVKGKSKLARIILFCCFPIDKVPGCGYVDLLHIFLNNRI